VYKHNIITVLIVLTIMSTAFNVPKAGMAQETLIFHYPALEQTFTVNAGGTLLLNGTFIVYQLAPVKFALYGDIVQTEGWNMSISMPALRLNKWLNLTIKLTVPSNASNREYGFIIIGYYNNVRVCGAVTYIDVKNGRPYTPPVYYYTDGKYIVGDNCPRDVYLPVKRVNVTMFYKSNITGMYYIDIGFQTGQSWVGWLDYPAPIDQPGYVYNFTYSWNPGYWRCFQPYNAIQK